MKKYLMLALVLSGMSGCGVLPKLDTNATFNDPADLSVSHRTKAGLSGAATIAETSAYPLAQERVFVGVALSGGGIRAANFGAAVLHELEKLGILSHVSAISSVSGGSVANAYFSVYGALPAHEVTNIGEDLEVYRKPFWDSFREAMSIDFRSEWVSRNFSPLNLLATSFTHKDRTDVLAETLDDKLFKGKTFGDLPKFGPLSPIILINATKLNELRHSLPTQTTRNDFGLSGLNTGFTFSHESFLAIRSRLDTFPISRAVAASAAFPGVFNPSTLQTFAKRQTDDRTYKAAEYLHLIDGGPSDNLGTDALVALLRRSRSNAFHLRTPPSTACLLIVVDASANQTATEGLSKSPDLRGAISHLIDLDFIDAFDALLQRRREDSLQELGVSHARFGERGEHSFLSVAPGYLKQVVHLSRRFNPDVVFPLSARPRQNSTNGGEVTSYSAQGGDVVDNDMRCAVWRISIDDVVSAGAPWAKSNAKLPFNSDEARRHTKSSAAMTRRRVWEIASRIGTDFNLVGPAGCTKRDLQKALWDAARIAVRDDHSSRLEVCSWMKSNGVIPFSSCADISDESLVWPIDSTTTLTDDDVNSTPTKYEIEDPVPLQYCRDSIAN